MDNIDITMTAVLRPKVIRGTLKSFCKNLFKEDRERYRLIINIDPVGDECDPIHIIDICKQFFSKVKYNIPTEPSFPRAVIWTWSHVTAPWCFHLEDDWTIYRSTDINHMISILNKHKDLACLRLYKQKIPKRSKLILFNSKYQPYDEGYLVADDQRHQFGLNPTLIKGDFVREAFPQMVDTKNPEKQFRWGNEVMRDFIMKWKYGIYGRPGDEMLVYGKRGLKWRRDAHLSKPVGKQFITWENRKQSGKYMK